MQRSKIYSLVFTFVVILLFISVFFITKNFLYDLIFALIIAHIFRPIYKLINRKFSSGFSSILLIFLLFIVVVIPLGIISIMAVQQGSVAFNTIQQNYYIVVEKIKSIDYNSFLIKYLGTTLVDFDINSKVSDLMSFLISQGAVLFKNTFFNFTSFLVHIFFILFFSYYFFKDHNTIKKSFFELLPIDNTKKEQFLSEFFKITDAIIKGTFLIGIIEGIFGATLFAFLGINSFILWGFFMMILSMIPIVGTNSILVPTAIYFFVTGSVVKGFILLIIGSGGILLSQNFLKPKLVGKSGGIHPAVVLVSSIGGIAWLGIVGFIVGPLIVSMFILSVKVLMYEVLE